MLLLRRQVRSLTQGAVAVLQMVLIRLQTAVDVCTNEALGLLVGCCSSRTNSLSITRTVWQTNLFTVWQQKASQGGGYGTFYWLPLRLRDEVLRWRCSHRMKNSPCDRFCNGQLASYRARPIVLRTSSGND